MKTYCHLLFYCSILCVLLAAGCGGKTASTGAPTQPVKPACAGTLLTGTMQDSLTGLPVAQGWAVLETVSQSPALLIYNFLPVQTASSDAKGGFSLCSPGPVAQPAALVLLALDATGKAYPASVSNVTGSASLGTFNMGGCFLICLVPEQQQTSEPAVITGTITSEPVAATGSVAAFYTLTGLDGSKNLWNLAMPSLVPTQTESFTTAAGTCPGNAPFCASYTMTVPTQKPLQPTATGSTQQAGPPGYTMFAVPAAVAGCRPPFQLTLFEQDGKTPLTATPEAYLVAGTLGFGACL